MGAKQYIVGLGSSEFRNDLLSILEIGTDSEART